MEVGKSKSQENKLAFCVLKTCDNDRGGSLWDMGSRQTRSWFSYVDKGTLSQWMSHLGPAQCHQWWLKTVIMFPFRMSLPGPQLHHSCSMCSLFVCLPSAIEFEVPYSKQRIVPHCGSLFTEGHFLEDLVFICMPTGRSAM